MRDRSVAGFMPSRSAAPPRPSMRPRVRRSVASMCDRTAASSRPSGADDPTPPSAEPGERAATGVRTGLAEVGPTAGPSALASLHVFS